MRLYELQKPGLEDELEKQLKGTAARIDQDKNQPDSVDPLRSQSQTPGQGAGNPDLPGDEVPGDITGDQSEPGSVMGEEPPEYEQKPTDTALFAATKSLPYASQYEFDEDSKIHPLNIMVLGMDELNNLRNLVRTKINLVNLTDEFGLYDDPATKFYQDLLNFVEKVISFRKQHDQDDDSPVRTAPPVNKQMPPKNNKAQEWTP